jgi:chromosome segregation ATPase
MPDVDQRLDHVEQGLKDLGERIDEQFAKVDQRFTQVDQRFAQVDQQFAQVDRRFGSLEAEVQKLRVLEEQNAAQIKQIAEVQAHHGGVLEEHGSALKRIEEAIEPLKALHEFIPRVADDHERRITALEEASRQRTPDP